MKLLQWLRFVFLLECMISSDIDVTLEIWATFTLQKKLLIGIVVAKLLITCCPAVSIYKFARNNCCVHKLARLLLQRIGGICLEVNRGYPLSIM